MTLMWRSGTSLQTLVLSFHYAGPRGTKLSHHRLTEPFPLSNLASLKDHLMYNFLLYFYLIGYYVFQKAKKKPSGIFYPVLQHIEHLFQEVARIPVSQVSARAVPACPRQPLVFAREHVLLLHSYVSVQTLYTALRVLYITVFVFPLVLHMNFIKSS